MRDSIFLSAIRSMMVTLFAVIGFCLGLIVIGLLTGLWSGKTALEPERIYSQEVVANANGERKAFSSTAPVILRLNIDGAIGLEDLSADSFRRQLMESREGELKDSTIKAILLHINSPGGIAVDADSMYRALKNYKEQYKVPVYAYVDGLCASGGMYIAVAADKIYASEVSLIGSVGVLMPSFLNFTQLMDKIGVQSLTVSAGKDKDELNPLRPWAPGEGDNMKEIVDDFYKVFVDVVVSNRPQIDREKLIKDYGAKIFSATTAKEYGFVDVAGIGYNDALREIVKQVGIEDENYQVVELQHKTWYSELFSKNNTLLHGKIVHEVKLPLEMDTRFNGQFLYMYRPAK
ncbi:MAG: S49 family peptidase [Parachlamydiaceae bacterium]|nr:S49 family peptidase [Parachlamydiaceae bacterium]